ncbi:MAG: S8 family serine peptidase, partial [Candidatus Acidiferrales bacterium]
VFNNAPGQIGVVLAPAAIPVFTISREDGLFLRDTIGFDGGGVSNFPIRINPEDPEAFLPETAGFSSRGPNNNFAVVKPDITAPGTSILMGASKLGALGSPTGFVSASGTSFSGPQVAGTAALMRDAVGGKPSLSPSQVRAALVNSSTNLRLRDNVTPVADDDDSVFTHETGGGLVEMVRALDLKAVMGTNELNGGGGPDNPQHPDFLPSFSFGRRAVVGTGLPAGAAFQQARIAVTVADVSGKGSSYTLSIVDAGALRGDVTRPLSEPGFSVSLGQSSVSVPKNGRATFEVSVAVDGTANGLQIAGTDNTGARATEFLWYVVATPSNASPSLRMPFYYRAVQGVAGGGVVGFASGSGWVERGDTRDHFNFSAEGTTPAFGEIRFFNPSQGLKLTGTVASMSVSGRRASFSGPCTLEDGTECNYSAVVEDNASPGRGADSFQISVTTAGGQSFQSSGLLGGGDIVVGTQ